MTVLPIDGLSLDFEELGTGSPVLFLHGLGSSGQNFRSVAPQLATSHRAIIPDRRGRGRSARPPEPAPERTMEDANDERR
jgi:3-oxoadipate enol-lactonase